MFGPLVLYRRHHRRQAGRTQFAAAPMDEVFCFFTSGALAHDTSGTLAHDTSGTLARNCS
jgi:hypothetical protein